MTVALGHHHLNVTSVDAHAAFWVDALGGTRGRASAPAADLVTFPNVTVALTRQRPTGGTIGSTVNHVSFETPDIRAAVDRLKAAGFPMVTRAQLPADYDVSDDLGQRGGGDIVAFVLGPDETKVELLENRAAPALRMHHIHFAAPDVQAMQAWYVSTFGAVPGPRAGFAAADLAGVNLTFSEASGPVVGTRGRVVDHIGFEVPDLGRFGRDLAARGVTLDSTQASVPDCSTVAFLTDPWGTYIELTEGLDRVP